MKRLMSLGKGGGGRGESATLLREMHSPVYVVVEGNISRYGDISL